MATTFTGPVHGAVADAVFAALLLAVCVSDLRTRRIANGLVATIALVGILYSVADSSVLAGSARAFGGLATGFLIWLPFYLGRFLGAGDVKFFAAASAWLGASSALRAALLAALCGAVLSVIWMIVTEGWRPALARLVAIVHRPRRVGAAGHPLPYALAMAVGLGLSAWLR
jgi:prepilin peptidase CpaA